MKTAEEIKEVIEWLPVIRKMIMRGWGWTEIGGICEKLGLTDTAFRENLSLDDFLLDESYWHKRQIINQTNK